MSPLAAHLEPATVVGLALKTHSAAPKQTKPASDPAPFALDQRVDLAGKERAIKARLYDTLLHLDIEDFGRATVGHDGIEHLALQPSIDPALLKTVLFGPLLLPLLAKTGLYCLHASAISKDDKVIAICGPSGAGKSTMSRMLSHLGWTHVADDQLLVLGHTRLIAPFPQLKVGSETSRSQGQLMGVLFLIPRPDQPITLQRIGKAAVATGLAKATSAIQLFDEPSRIQHHRWAAQLGAQLHATQLHFSHCKSEMKKLGDTVSEVCNTWL